jgi:hypothetical protein
MLDFTLHAMQASLGDDEGDASSSEEDAMALQQAHKSVQLAGSRDAGARGKGLDDDAEDDAVEEEEEEEDEEEQEEEEQEEEGEELDREEGEDDVEKEEAQVAKRSRRHDGSSSRRAVAAGEVAAEVEEDRKTKRKASRDLGHDHGAVKGKVRESQRAQEAGAGERQPRNTRVTALPAAEVVPEVAPRADATPLKRSRQGEEEASSKGSSKRASRVIKSAKKASSK